ncbi:MAG: TauD/TfdA family dioxygenase [Kofleriaceae bacterium]
MTNSDKPQGLSKLRAIKRKSVVLSSEDLVSYEPLGAGGLPLLITPKADQLDLPVWAAQHRDALRAKLQAHGALLFRGFSSPSIETFSATVRSVSGEPLRYAERSSPRHAVDGNVYTSTDYPPEYPIFLHNEQSYNVSWCRVISFHCAQAPGGGGQTPLADTRRILARLDPALVERFASRRYLYQRNFGDGFGLSWQVAFQTESKAEVDAYCRANRIETEWKDGDRLRTRQVREAVHHHPDTGARVWFNHATFFHVTTLPPPVRDTLLAGFAEEDLPNHTYYGDGASIEPDVMAELQQAYLDEKVLFDWQAGDVLLVDNMLSSHGREPFSGPRRVLTAMSEPSGAARGPGGAVDAGASA